MPFLHRMKFLGKKQLLKKDHWGHCIITCLTSLIYICALTQVRTEMWRFRIPELLVMSQIKFNHLTFLHLFIFLNFHTSPLEPWLFGKKSLLWRQTRLWVSARRKVDWCIGECYFSIRLTRNSDSTSLLVIITIYMAPFISGQSTKNNVNPDSYMLWQITLNYTCLFTYFHLFCILKSLNQLIFMFYYAKKTSHYGCFLKLRK